MQPGRSVITLANSDFPETKESRWDFAIVAFGRRVAFLTARSSLVVISFFRAYVFDMV